MRHFCMFLGLSILPFASYCNASQGSDVPPEAKYLIKRYFPEDLTTHKPFITKGPFIASRGSDGYRGPHGPRGKKGPKGKRGKIGPIGFQGPSGYQGIQGQLGPIGPQGPLGDEGPTGPMGLEPTGSIGPTGPNGSTGATGQKGPSSLTLDAKSPFVWDEFFSGNNLPGKIGSLGWSFQGQDWSASNTNGISNHPGILNFGGGITPTAGEVNPIWVNDPIDMKAIIQVGDTGAASFGFQYLNPSSLSNFFWFHGVIGDPVSNWSIVTTIDDVSSSPIITGVPVVSGSWVKFRIHRSTYDGPVDFYINGTLVASIPSGDLPTNLSLSPFFQSYFGTFNIDYFSLNCPDLDR